MPAVNLCYYIPLLFFPFYCRAVLVGLYRAPATRVSRYIVVVRWHKLFATLYFRYVKPCEWNHDVRVPGDKSLVKISEAQEGLNVLHLAGFWPVLYCLNFGLQPFLGKDEAEVFHCIGGEVTLVRTCV